MRSFLFLGCSVYLTKEWFWKKQLSCLDKIVSVHKEAEWYDKAFYRQVRNAYYKRFERNELSGAGGYFDKIFVKKMFKVKMKSMVKLVSYLPKNILEEVADIRVLALGYVSEKVKKMLDEYCRQLCKECDCILQKARRKTDMAESMLPKRISVNGFGELLLYRLYRKNKDIFLEFEGGRLKFENGEILKQERKRIYRYGDEEAYSRWSMVQYAELTYDKGIFTLYFLINNMNRKGKPKYWELVISGTNIVEYDDICL